MNNPIRYNPILTKQIQAHLQTHNTLKRTIRPRLPQSRPKTHLITVSSSQQCSNHTTLHLLSPCVMIQNAQKDERVQNYFHYRPSTRTGRRRPVRQQQGGRYFHHGPSGLVLYGRRAVVVVAPEAALLVAVTPRDRAAVYTTVCRSAG